MKMVNFGYKTTNWLKVMVLRYNSEFFFVENAYSLGVIFASSLNKKNFRSSKMNIFFLILFFKNWKKMWGT